MKNSYKNHPHFCLRCAFSPGDISEIAIKVRIIYIYYRKNLGRVLSCEVTRGAQHKNSYCRGFSWHTGAIFFADATIADCSIAETLCAEFQAEYLLADRGYDTDAIIRLVLHAGMAPVIPPQKRKVLRDYDKHLYKLRHLDENAFLQSKKWRGIATRYNKNVTSFVAAVPIRCIALWLKVY